MVESMHESVIRNLQKAKGRWRSVAEATGVPKRTIEKIASRQIADPGVTSIETLARYFSRTAQSA